MCVQNISLEVNPHTEIGAAKDRLLEKVALVDAASAVATKDTNKDNIHGTATAAAVLCVLSWMTAFTQHLLRNISAAHRLHASDLYLMHGGKPLDDDAFWSDYHGFAVVANNKGSSGNHHCTTVTVQPRVRGGCFMVSASVLAMLCTAVVGSTCTCGVSLIAVPFLLPLLFVLPLFCL